MKNIELVEDLKELGLDINSEELNLSANSKKEILELLSPISDFLYSYSPISKYRDKNLFSRYRTVDSSGYRTENITDEAMYIEFYGNVLDFMGRSILASYSHFLNVSQLELSPEAKVIKWQHHRNDDGTYNEILNKEWHVQISKNHNCSARYPVDADINCSLDMVIDDDHFQMCRYYVTENGDVFHQTDTLDFRKDVTKKSIELFDKQSSYQIIQNFRENSCVGYEDLTENISQFIKIKELKPTKTRNISVTLNGDGSKTLNMTDESNHLLATSNIVDSESLDIPSTVKINGFVDDHDIYTYMVSSDNYIKNTGPAHK